MKNFLKSKPCLRRFFKEEDGATAIEYGLIVGLIAVAIIATVGALGGEINGLFEQVSEKLEAVATEQA